MRISDWSSDVCSSDLILRNRHNDKRGQCHAERNAQTHTRSKHDPGDCGKLGRACDKSEREDDHDQRSEEGRVGKEWVSTWRSRWAPYHLQTNTKDNRTNC